MKSSCDSPTTCSSCSCDKASPPAPAADEDHNILTCNHAMQCILIADSSDMIDYARMHARSMKPRGKHR